MIVNGKALLELAPIKNMEPSKIKFNGVSYGLGEAGYDIRLKQEIKFYPQYMGGGPAVIHMENGYMMNVAEGRFTIASAIEEFDMPDNLVGIVHDKSTWARKGISVFNTVIEPGWKGFLTLEIVYHGDIYLHLPAGAGIAQVVFHQTIEKANYSGKYQNQADKPVGAIYE